MKQIYEVTLTYVALVLAEDSEDAEEIARDECNEITSDDTSPRIECGVSFRSRAELAAWGGIEGSSWSGECMPYAADDTNKKCLSELLEDIEVADGAATARCTKTVDMFEEPKPVAEPEPVRPPDFQLVVARRHAQGGEDWHWCRLEYIGDGGEGSGALIEGGIPNIDFEGKKRWTGVRTEKVFVTEVQVQEAAKVWEVETGKCMCCAGSKKVSTGWHHGKGNTFADCKRCDDTGKAPEVAS